MNNTRSFKISYFLCLSILAVFAVLVGFAKTFIIPVSNGNFAAPAIVYVHGAFAFCWILLFIIQSSLINLKKYRTHMLLGWFGLLVATGTAVTMPPVGIYAVNKELSQGLGDTAISTLLGTCTSALVFLSIVTAAIINRKYPATHKRLMLMATIVVLWPAWFRFRHYFPSLPRPDIWFALVLADSLIIISCIWDKIVNGRIHPVFKYVGSLIILEHIFEVVYFDSPNWRIVSKYLYQILV